MEVRTSGGSGAGTGCSGTSLPSFLFFFFMFVAQECYWNGFWAKLSLFLSCANIKICMHSAFSESNIQKLLSSMQIKVCMRVCVTSQKRRQAPINTHFLQVLAVFRWGSWLVYWERLGTWQYRLQIYPSPPEKGRFKEGLQPWRYGLLRVFPLLYLIVRMESWVWKNCLVRVFSWGYSDLCLLLTLEACTRGAGDISFLLLQVWRLACSVPPKDHGI